MDIRKDKFLASLLAFGLLGAAACGSSENADEAAEGTDMTTGGDTMAEPMDDPGMGDPGMDDPGMGEEPPADDMGGGEDMGPTPE